MNFDTFIQYFSDSQWLATFLTNFVTIFVPIISLLASLIFKYKNATSTAIKEFKDKFEQEFRDDLAKLKYEYAKLDESLKEQYKLLEESTKNTAKSMAVLSIAYANSNLSNSVKNEIVKITQASEVTEDTITEANQSIEEAKALDKVEVPEVLEEIADEVSEDEQNNIVL